MNWQTAKSSRGGVGSHTESPAVQIRPPLHEYGRYGSPSLQNGYVLSQNASQFPVVPEPLGVKRMCTRTFRRSPTMALKPSGPG